MGKQLHFDPAAEREATEIGKQFMNSTDVVGDMSRKYGRDLSSVRIHTDESAAQKAAQRKVDAFSTGKDVFFARGAFDKNDPASRGLLAHELSHSIQQGVGDGALGLQQSAPMGAEQGGLIDWFRRTFGLRRKPTKEQLAALNAEDAKYARWDQEKEDHVQDVSTNGMPDGMPLPDGKCVEADFDQLTRRANELGWTNRSGEAFDRGMTENFFREISGRGVSNRLDASGRSVGEISTGYRSMEDMAALFENHDEATTMRMLKPLMDLNVEEFIQQYPLHRMTADQRRAAFPQMDAVFQPMLGMKQWAEKYGITTLSPANQKRLEDQIVRFEKLSQWVYSMRVPAPVSFDQGYEMNLKNMEDMVKGDSRTDEMKKRASQVKQGLGAAGCMLSMSEFKKIMGKHMTGRGSDAGKVKQLGNTFAGLSYDKQTGMVISPLPLGDLKALAAGDKGVMSRYAKQLQSMDWSDEHDRERRAAQYDASTEEFIGGFDSDASYFGRMSNMAAALEMFGNDFVEQQGDDLKARMLMARNTFAMMGERAGSMGINMADRFERQYSGMQNRTWIKRLFLGRKYK